jgi:hypothetical protein
VTSQDLITDEPFTRKDLIQIQDPMNLAGKELSKFDHVIKDINVPQPEPEKFSNINSAVSERTRLSAAHVSVWRPRVPAQLDVDPLHVGGAPSETERAARFV